MIRHGPKRPKNIITEIILHHTGGSTASGAISTLKKRGLGYHYIIGKDGTIHSLIHPDFMAWHAKGYNSYTIGISYVGGGKPGGPITKESIEASVNLIKELKKDYPLATIAGHKHRSKSGKWDPDGKYVDVRDVARKAGLKFQEFPKK